MSTAFFLKGIILGFSIAAPVGPIGLLCINRTLTGGMLVGFLSGAGAATADGLYGCVAAFGVSAVSSLLVESQFGLRLAGGVFLLYLGYGAFRAKPSETRANTGSNSLAGAYLSTLFLTLTNPMTILSFAGIFAGLGIGDAQGNVVLAGLLVAGVFMGSLLWWMTLSGVVGLLRSRFDTGRLMWVNRLSGVIICGFGVFSLLSVF
ncbi:MAG: LysE family transporter [Synergistota bacterium]|nr:LysE family transporter [Synergistota bacterium]